MSSRLALSSRVTTCLFLGPSLPLDEARSRLPDARFLPPAQHGDVVAAVERWSPALIGVIDGYFRNTPSVWHKEILWALSRGVHVFGAASMGALRAAELESFGMIGIGKVFEGFRAGALPPFDGLCGDDEVAVVHGPAESGYVVATDALVNIRCTLEAARSDGVIDETVASALLERARALHFPERTYARVLELAREHGTSEPALQRLADWLPAGKVDQKRRDALSLVEHLAELQSARPSPHDACFAFEPTEIWNDALPAMRARRSERGDLASHRRDVIDELRLNESAYVKAKREAILRSVLIAATEPDVRSETASGPRSATDAPLEAELLRRCAEEFRTARELWDRERVDAWLAANELDVAGLDELIRDEARLARWTGGPDSASAEAALIDHLRLSGEYPRLSARAKAKASTLAGADGPSPSARQLLRWHFETRRARAIPDDIDAHARRLGLVDAARFIDLLAREYRYRA